jgi:chromate transporter
VFYGIRPASVGLITAAALSIFVIAILQIDVFNATRQAIDLIRPKRILLAVALFFAIRKWKPHPVTTIAISAVIGAVFRFADP